MDSNFPLPCMSWDAVNLSEAWKKFEQHARLVFAGPLSEKEEEVQCKYLLLWVGDRGREIYNTWNLSAENQKVLNTICTKFTEHVTPTANPVFARYKFHSRGQAPDEGIEDFTTALRKLSVDCAFGNKTDEMIRDRIVFATNSKSIREKLLNEGADLTLDKAIKVARNYEYSKQQLKEMSKEQEVHAVRHKSKPKQDSSSSTPKPKTPYKGPSKPFTKPQAARSPDTDHKECTACGRQHPVDECPAKGRRCGKCGKWNHFAIKCHLFSRTQRSTKKVYDVQETEPPDFFIDSIQTNKEDQVFVDVQLCSKVIKFKVDSGSQVNILPKHMFDTLHFEGQLQDSDCILSPYGASPLQVLGMCQLPCVYKGKQTCLKVYIVRAQGHRTLPPLLGLRSSQDLQILKIVSTVNAEFTKEAMMSQYADVFQGLGLLPGECQLRLEPDAVPVVHAPRKVPHALSDKLKAELDRMESSKVITKVTEPTDWVNSIVVVEKPNGSLRICLDPQDLNRVLKRPHYPMRTLDEISPKLSGAKYFSIFDARSGYWSIKLSEESSLLTTFNTPFGRYKFNRLPFGVKSAQDEFQRRIDEVYEGVNGVDTIVDDIIVYGNTTEEHDQNVRSMLQRSRERGVKLNPDKVQFRVDKVGYFGHVLSEAGIEADPKKVSAIVDMEPPKDKSELQTIMGMVNYLSKFASNLSSITAPMRSLLKQDVEYVWDAAQKEAFDNMKTVISNTPVLAYYDNAMPITLQVDASKYGLGATLMQDGRPVAYASKALTPSEVNYAQIEKEMYAILFGCQRFHQYVYGNKVLVESNHKPMSRL
jgi:hypothetical protein